MRSAQEMKDMIIGKATSDERVRAVLLNGSRANPNVTPDKLQDFDVVYVVHGMQTFIADHSWVDSFGGRLIWQLPDEMALYTERGNADESFAYLMLFEDGNRIDLTLVPSYKIDSNYRPEHLTVVWLDKDGLFSKLSQPNDSDYWIKKPTEKEFLETCNEFWWVSTYVAKGLVRSEITYAKHMMETVVRPMFMKIMAWYIGTQTDFSVSFGKHGAHIERYLSVETYHRILKTYSDHQLETNWTALATTAELLGVYAPLVADRLDFQYRRSEEDNVLAYIEKIRIDRN